MRSRVASRRGFCRRCQTRYARGSGQGKGPAGVGSGMAAGHSTHGAERPGWLAARARLGSHRPPDAAAGWSVGLLATAPSADIDSASGRAEQLDGRERTNARPSLVSPDILDVFFPLFSLIYYASSSVESSLTATCPCITRPSSAASCRKGVVPGLFGRRRGVVLLRRTCMMSG